MDKNRVLLDTNPLQKDLRIRMPKQILTNLPVEVGTHFNIYLDTTNSEIILQISDTKNEEGIHG